MSRKVLFLHLPKTSGTSLKLFLKDQLGDFFIQANTAQQLRKGDPLLGRVRDLDDIRAVLDSHAGLALHVDSSFSDERRTTDYRSLAHYVFDERYAEYFGELLILTMMRRPFERFLSEFAFLQRAKAADPGFLPDLELDTPDAYLERVHANPTLHFLLQEDLDRARSFDGRDLEKVEKAIVALPVHIGVYERYEESIDYFSVLLGRRFSVDDLPRFNVGRGAPARDPRLERAFAERNPLDGALYETAQRRLDEWLASAATESEPSV